LCVQLRVQVTDKTRSDLQGGTLIEYEGKAKLVELSQVPREHEGDFKSLKTFNCFNTNNLWVSRMQPQRPAREPTSQPLRTQSLRAPAVLPGVAESHEGVVDG